MKKIGEYTTRGQVASATTTRIILFDGRFDTAYRIVDFQVAPQNPNSGNNAYGKLTTMDDSGSNPADWNWGDNQEWAWAGTYGVSDGIAGHGEFIDPDNLIVEDLYFYGIDSANDRVNYMVKLEKYDVGDWRGALAMVRNSAQGEPST